MSAESSPNNTQPPSPLTPVLSQRNRAADWFQRLTGRLGVGPKISLGYGIVLGLATLGTSAGIILGDYYQHEAKERTDHTASELQLLHRLQASVLQARTHQQQFIPLLQSPDLLIEEYAHFQSHMAEIEVVWSEIVAFSHMPVHSHEAHADEVSEFLADYNGVSEEYLQNVAVLLQQIAPGQLSLQDQQALQAQLLQFTNSEVALDFDSISDNLTDIIQDSYTEYRLAQTELLVAEAMRTQILIGSMLLSIVIATGLAWLTSRAIAQPIKAVTQVAQQSTRDSNFDLQAPVTTRDEVGILAASLNRLMHRVKTLLEEQQAESSRHLIQSEKMSSLGRMLAGVAHEINNPVNFIYGNLKHADEYIQDLLNLINTYEAELPAPLTAVEAQAEEIDLEFLKTDLPKMVKSMQLGADRVKQIVLSLKNFSRLDEAEANSVDLHSCIDSTLLILNNRIKRGVTVVKHYGDVPYIDGYSGLLYQVFMNLLGNAVEALDEVTEPDNPKQITITTRRRDQDWVEVKIADTGPGIPAVNQDKVFETFFTTKPRGVGTGLGLSITQQIVEEKHGGQVTFISNPGAGTEFTIALPIQAAINTAPVALPPMLAGQSA